MSVAAFDQAIKNHPTKVTGAIVGVQLYDNLRSANRLQKRSDGCDYLDGGNICVYESTDLADNGFKLAPSSE